MFWPANGFPIWLMVTLLQFHIPLSVLFRHLKMGLAYRKLHYIAAVLIIISIVINLCDLALPEYIESQNRFNSYLEYIILFMCSSVIDNVSQTIKENTVRSVPIDQDRFTFAISLSQLICGICISPIILAINKNFVDYATNPKLDPT